MRKTFAFLAVFLCIFSIIGVAAQDEMADTSTDTSAGTIDTTDSSTQEPEQEQTTEQAPEELVNPGTLPDSPFYFVDNLVEQVMVGDNPERALAYKEEKIAEAQAMIEQGNAELAQEVLEKALDYGDIVEAEVSPELKRDVQESSEKIQYALKNMKTESEDKNLDIEEDVDAVIEKEKKIDTAAELVSKINELCNALAKLDPLQYADTCKSDDNSPKWMKEKDKEMTKEQEAQAKLFFDKLSQCFESPENCDCKGMGVQSFEDFCIEKSESAIACINGDETACKVIESSDPSNLLPSYLMPIFEKVSSKYMGSQMELHMPEECAKAGATTPKECNKIMFNTYAPQECVDSGLTGESRGDEIKCRQIMFETNTPQECIDVGITADDPDAPRKCSKIMFALNAPQECIDAGITGESRDDQTKCANLMGGMGQQMGMGNGPRFNKDCNSIQDAAEKIKCFEEFYNNAQVNMREDFRKQEFIPNVIAGGQKCPDGICDDFEKRNPSACPIDCGGSSCQSQSQIETLKQDCINRGQGANVENRNGCPWVICVSQGYNTQYSGMIQQQVVSGSSEAGGGTGQKCPDGICDDYERMNPYACPMDCGGGQMPPAYQQPPIGEQLPPDYQAPGTEPTYTGEAPIPTEQPPAPESGGESAPITGQVVNPYLVYWWS